MFLFVFSYFAFANLEDWTICADLQNEKIDWTEILRKSRFFKFQNPQNETNDEFYQKATDLYENFSLHGGFQSACFNGISTILTVLISRPEKLRNSWQKFKLAKDLRFALSKSFLIDASLWPINNFLAFEFLKKLDLKIEKEKVENFVNFLFPVENDAAGLVFFYENFYHPLKAKNFKFKVFSNFCHFAKDFENFEEFQFSNFSAPPGKFLNFQISALPDGQFVFLAANGLLPKIENFEEFFKIFQKGNFGIVGGSLTDREKVFTDFSWIFSISDWQLKFEKNYFFHFKTGDGLFDGVAVETFRSPHSTFYGDPSKAKPPCKLADSTSPSFFSTTTFLKNLAANFDEEIHNVEILILDFFLNTKLFSRSSYEKFDFEKGTDGQQFFVVSCPHLEFEEPQQTPHLWGRSDFLRSEEFQRAYYFEDFDLKIFSKKNDVKEFFFPDGHFKNLGCSLTSQNCEMSWIYRGFSIPPCCKKTLLKLLDYLHETFKELGIRYVLTDGALLGAAKFQNLLNWDGDVDLHIHSEDFDTKIESLLLPRVLKDGYHMRKHANGQSWLVQATLHNYLLIELNKRQDPFNDDVFVNVNNRIYKTLKTHVLNITSWYGADFFENRLRSAFIGRPEDVHENLFCSVQFHQNCQHEKVLKGKDCKMEKIC